MFTLTLLDADGEPNIGFDVSEPTFDSLSGGDVLIIVNGVTFHFHDCAGDEVFYAPVKVFQLQSDDGELYQLTERTD